MATPSSRPRAASAMLALVLLSGLLGCDEQQVAPLEVDVGVGEPVQFKPKAAFAEYVELPGLRNELRITLADYEASCEQFVPPPEGKVMVSVVVATPSSMALQPGSYTWAGPELRGTAAGVQAHPVAEPTVRIGSKGYLFGAGGGVQLQAVNLDEYGEVSGVMGFEAAAADGRGPSRVRGRFRAKICRSNRAPAPQ
ncbi:MAG: hypothetical protein AB7K71_12085 [Polyangiaceae bacterium]